MSLDAARCHLRSRQTCARSFQREIDSPFGVIDGHVLPEVRQLQGGAGEIGELLPFGIAIAAQVQHQMSDRIGRVLAITRHIGECRIARSSDPAGTRSAGSQTAARNVKLAHGRRLERRIQDAAGSPRSMLQLALPTGRAAPATVPVSHLVTQIVRDAAVGIDIEKMLAQPLGQQPGYDREILVMMRPGGAILLRLREVMARAREWRTPPVKTASQPKHPFELRGR